MTVTYTRSQSGYDNGAAWASGTMTVTTIGATLTGGIQFTIPAPDQLLFRSLVLTLTPIATPTPSGTLSIGLVDDINEAPFESVTPNMPSGQATIPVYSAAHTFVVDTAESFSLQLGVEPLQSGQYIGQIESAMQVLGHSAFQGNVALVITFTGSVSFSGIESRSSLVGDETPFLTGLPTSKNRQSRADWCPRCGQPIFREHLVRDGYTKTLVCSDCWDRDEQRFPHFVPLKEINPR